MSNIPFVELDGISGANSASLHSLKIALEDSLRRTKREQKDKKKQELQPKKSRGLKRFESIMKFRIESKNDPGKPSSGKLSGSSMSSPHYDRLTQSQPVNVPPSTSNPTRSQVVSFSTPHLPLTPPSTSMNGRGSMDGEPSLDSLRKPSLNSSSARASFASILRSSAKFQGRPSVRNESPSPSPHDRTAAPQSSYGTGYRQLNAPTSSLAAIAPNPTPSESSSKTGESKQEEADVVPPENADAGEVVNASLSGEINGFDRPFSEGEKIQRGLQETEKPSSVNTTPSEFTSGIGLTERKEECMVFHSQRYLEKILEHRVRVVFREITRDGLQPKQHPPTIIWHRWNETQQGRRRMPLDPIIERCRQVVDIDGLQDVNDEFQPWYHVQWHYPDHNDHLSDSGSRSLPQAVAIYSATTVEILPLDDQPWLLDLHSSEALRDLVLADKAVDLTAVTGISLSEARAIMILLDYVLSCFRWCASHQRRLHRAIRTITKTFGENCLPPAFYLSGVLLDGNDAIGGGGFADTFKGTLGDQAVCLKVLRVFVVADPDERKKSIQTFLDEAIIWRHLRHPNILPFLGISQDAFAPRNSTCFVSSFMAKGDLMQFLKRNPEHDRTACLFEIAKGLQYLHASNICHGDVKGANVLVDDDNHCRLADFGITSLICSNSVTADLANTTQSTKGSSRWMAPELFEPSSYLDPTRVRAAPRDVYAFACTSLEVITGKPPFPELPEASVLLSVLRGARPARPQQVESFTDELWNLIERCWAQDPEARPTFDDITIIIGGIISREGT